MKAARKAAKKRVRDVEFEDVLASTDLPIQSTSDHRSTLNTNFSANDNVPQHDAKRPRLTELDSPLKIPDEEILKRVYTRPQGASAYMDAFRPKFESIINAMMTVESPPTMGMPCNCGAIDAKKIYNCRDCSFFEPCCSTCFLEIHRQTPYHWAHKWNGKFLEKQDISQLGHVITYGHDLSGGSCPHARTKPLDFTIVDINGVHETKVNFCACLGNNLERFDHLLRAYIFPATISQPQMGFTFNLLKDFHLQTLTSKKAPNDYIFAIRQKTSNMFVNNVPDPYSQFLRIQRIWRVLTIKKNSGQAHNIDEYFPLRRPGNVMVPCFSCPEPGFNVPEEQWESIDEELQFLNTLFIMKDGHFGLQRLAKTAKHDPDDVSLLDGAGLFPPDAEYNDYVRGTVAYSEEKTTCSKFNAVEMQNKIKFKGAVITGVLAVECMRHTVFLSMVDLQKGERYANADYALAYALRRFTFLQSMSQAKYFSRILETYDVACQYYVHLKQRMQDSFPDLADAVDLMTLLVPKKHLDGHKDDCKYRFSLNYTDGAGRSHGEGIEASWAESKQSGGSTRHMNHGHRHDTLIDFHNYWNWNKVRGLGISISGALTQACAKREKMIDHFIGLSIMHGKDLITTWETESTQPWMQNGEWQSVYRLQQTKLPSQNAMLDSLEAAERLQKTNEKLNSGRMPSSVRLIHNGIKLQEKQMSLQHAIKYDGLDPNIIRSRRQSLLLEIHAWRKTQLRAIPALEERVLSLDPNIDPEHEDLLLPSNVPLEDHDKFGFAPFVQVELKLREGQANDAVTGLCNSILHAMVLRDAKNEQARGVYQNTRASKFINTVRAKKTTSTMRYNEARSKLLVLTRNNITTRTDFPELKDEDTYAKNAASARNLGDGKKIDSWIWTFGRLKGLSQAEKNIFTIESQKVQWFRARADMMRWVEEVELLDEEFRRLIRGLEKMADVWDKISMPPNDATGLLHSPGYCAYAARKGHIFSQMALGERKRFISANGRWPAQGESLSQHILSRRPALTVDWDQIASEKAGNA